MSEQVNYRQQWADGEIEAGTLLDAIDYLQYANFQLAQKFGVAHAEVEALRVALLEIASANPAERGIEWAKSYASDGLKGAGSELYARWLDTFKEAEAPRAENARLRAVLEQSRDLIVEMSTHCNATALVADWLERNQ